MDRPIWGRISLFYLVAFALSGLFFGIQEFFGVPGWLQLPNYGPALSALLLLRLEKQNIPRFLRGSFAFRIDGPTLALLCVPVVIAVSVSWLTSVLWGLANLRNPEPGISPIVMIVAAVVGIIGEEVGWRGYLLPRLQERFNPFVSSMILVILWGVWHVPKLLMGFPVFALWFVSMIGMNLLHTWVYNRTAPSLWPVILLHAAINLTAAFLLASFFEPSVLALYAGACLFAGLALVVLDRKAFFAGPARKDHVPVSL